jgi:[ribosomal protein S5]-alanine N-acetyltransferase
MIPPVVPAGRLRDRAQPQLTAGGLVLCPFDAGDTGRLVEAYADPAIRRWHVRSMDEAGALDLAAGRGEAAFWVLPDARGRGVAVRALHAATAWMFGEAGFHRLELVHSTLNEASCRVAHWTGYRFEGTQRGQGLHEDGWHDMHLHARLTTDPECT